jgi:hypothetical protein
MEEPGGCSQGRSHQLNGGTARIARFLSGLKGMAVPWACIVHAGLASHARAEGITEGRKKREKGLTVGHQGTKE